MYRREAALLESLMKRSKSDIKQLNEQSLMKQKNAFILTGSVLVALLIAFPYHLAAQYQLDPNRYQNQQPTTAQPQMHVRFDGLY